jgi:hypothetical protein
VSQKIRIGIGFSLIALPLLLHFFWVYPGAHETNLPIPSGIPGYNYSTLPRISSFDDARLQRHEGENAVAFADRILKVVNLATYHCDVNDFRHSWWTWLAAKTHLIERQQGVLSTSKFVCGFCHQRAFVLAKALRRSGLEDAATYGLNGHVVTVYSANGKRYAIDADYGVRSFEFPESADINSDVIAAHYSTEAPGYKENVYKRVSGFYSSTDDNDYYYTFEYLNEIALSQRKILSLEPMIGGAMLMFGIGILFGPALLKKGKNRRS